MQTTKTTRDSNFELLRIVAMLCIVFCHFATHSQFAYPATSLTVPRLWWFFLKMGGDLGVNVFVLISGYFLSTSPSGKLNTPRVLKFWAQIFFYSTAIYAVCTLIGISQFDPGDLITVILPITFEKWWFLSTYFVMYLLHPCLNIVIKKLDQKSYKNLVILLIVMWSVIPTVTLQNFQVNNLLWFFTLYMVAGYIRLYGFPGKLNRTHYTCLFLLATVLRYLSGIIPAMFADKVEFFAMDSVAFYGKTNITTFLSALFLFMIFKETKMGYHKWINVIASATFGVYLIHDHYCVRPYLWTTLIHGADYQESSMVIPYSIGVVLLIFAVCTVIDLIRQATVEKLYLNLVDKIVSSKGNQ